MAGTETYTSKNRQDSFGDISSTAGGGGVSVPFNASLGDISASLKFGDEVTSDSGDINNGDTNVKFGDINKGFSLKAFVDDITFERLVYIAATIGIGVYLFKFIKNRKTKQWDF